MRNFLLSIVCLITTSTFAQEGRTIEAWRAINETSLFRASTFDIGFDYTRNYFYGGLSAGRMHNQQIDNTVYSQDEYTVGNYAKLRIGAKSLPKTDEKLYFGIFGELNLGVFSQQAFSNVTISNQSSTGEFSNTYLRQGVVFSAPIGFSFNIYDVGFDFGIRYNRMLTESFEIEGVPNSEALAENYYNGLRIPTPGYFFIDQGKSKNPDFDENLSEAVIDFDLFLRVHYTFDAFGFFYY